MKNITLAKMKPRHTKLSFLLSLFFCFSFIVKGQDNTFGTWTSIGIEKDLSNWDVTSEIELRQFDFYGKPQRASLELGTSYKISKRFDVGGAYKIMRTYDEKYDDYQTRHRFEMGIQSDVKLGRFDLALRGRFDYTTRDESDRVRSDGRIDTYRINPALRWRNRLKIRYDIPNAKLEPGISAETFYQLNNPDGNKFEKIRYTLSVSYDVADQHELVLFGLLNQEFEDSEQDHLVFGISYYFKLN